MKRHLLIALVPACLALPVLSATAPPVQHEAVYVTAAPGQPLPADLLSPEGRTRWDLTSFPQGTKTTITVREAEGSNGRWLLPHRRTGALVPGTRETLDLDPVAGAPAGDPAGRARRVDTEIVGIGWVHLPSGPREAVLQRALIQDRGAASEAASWRLVHRWIDPRAGVVAEVGGPADPSGTRRLGVDEARVLDEVLFGAATLKIYVDELDTPALTTIAWGYDKGPGALVSSMTPEAYANIGALVAANSWDFSGVTSVSEIASTGTAVNAAETCNFAKCGYTVAGAKLGREDRFSTDPNQQALTKTNATTVREVRATDTTVWTRGGSQNEGVAGSLGTGESGFCYVSDGVRTRNPVPLFRFSNQDAGGWFMQAGDPIWSGGPGGTCQQTLFNEVCDGGGFASELWAKSCSGHTGLQSGEAIKGGVITLPSGHTFNALLIRIIADFCVYTGSSCFLNVDQVRTVNYLWQVPVVGTIARLQSEQTVPDNTSWGILDQTDIKFGLFPPRTITVTGTTDTSVSISWDPGLKTHRISGYKISWDTDSGASTPYAFNSVSHPGQVSIAGTTATLSGLTTGVPYHITVVSRSTYTDPSSGVVTTYESLLYPTQISGDPSFVYPIEVMATPGPPACQPTVEVGDVTVDYAAGGNVQICWTAPPDACRQGYRVLGSDTVNTDTGYGTVTDTAPTCWTGNPDDTYFLVIGRSTAGTGPWGHYGH